MGSHVIPDRFAGRGAQPATHTERTRDSCLSPFSIRYVAFALAARRRDFHSAVPHTHTHTPRRRTHTHTIEVKLKLAPVQLDKG